MHFVAYKRTFRLVFEIARVKDYDAGLQFFKRVVLFFSTIEKCEIPMLTSGYPF